jgi:hypothetical protein
LTPKQHCITPTSHDEDSTDVGGHTLLPTAMTRRRENNQGATIDIVRDSVQSDKSDYLETDRSSPGNLGGSNVSSQLTDQPRRCRGLSGDPLMRSVSSGDEPNSQANAATSETCHEIRRSPTAVSYQGQLPSSLEWQTTSPSTRGADIVTSKTADSGGLEEAMLNRAGNSTSGNELIIGARSLGEDKSDTMGRITSREAPAREVSLLPCPIILFNGKTCE